MTDVPTFFDDEAALAVTEGMSVLEMIGELLAVAAHYIQRRRGGPGVFRRLLSIIIAFVTVIAAVMIRGRATMHRHIPVAASRILRHLRCPPSRWAGT